MRFPVILPNGIVYVFCDEGRGIALGQDEPETEWIPWATLMSMILTAIDHG